MPRRPRFKVVRIIGKAGRLPQIQYTDRMSNLPNQLKLMYFPYFGKR